MSRHIDGVSMWSSLGPILANTYLRHFEKQWLLEYGYDIILKVYRRFVANIFVICICQSRLNDYMNYRNTKYSNIKFTSEFWKNESFFILDVKITCRNNELVTSIFRNATFSDVFMNFQIFLSMTHKLAYFTLYFLPFPFILHSSLMLLKGVLFKKCFYW